MAAQNWAVVCGIPRNAIEVGMIFQDLVQLRNDGLLDGVVISTWNRALDDFPELRDNILQHGFTLVQSGQPKEPGNGNTLRQHMSLYAGMKACPCECNIFKLRTDKCVHRLGKFRRLLQQGPSPVDQNQLGKLAPILNSKIAVEFASLSMPFNIMDVVFYGNRSDLDKLITFERYFDDVAFPGSMNAEIRFFSTPFLQAFPIFREFFENLNCRKLSQALLVNAEQASPLPLPEFINQVLALYFLLMATHFEIVHESTYDGLMAFVDLFATGRCKTAVSRVEITNAAHAQAKSGKVFSLAVNGELEPSLAQRSLTENLARLRSGESKASRLSEEDRTAICNFIQSTGLAVDDVVRRTVRITLGSKSTKTKPGDIDPLSSCNIPPTDRAWIETELQKVRQQGGLVVALHRIGMFYRIPENASAANQEQARYWLEQSAALRHDPSIVELAKLHIDMGNQDQALELLEQATQRGNREARRILAEIGSARALHE